MSESTLERIRELVGSARHALSDALHLCTRDLQDEPAITEVVHGAYSACWEAVAKIEEAGKDAAA